MDGSGGSGGGSEDGSSVGGSGGSVGSVVTVLVQSFAVKGKTSEPAAVSALAVMLYVPASRLGTCKTTVLHNITP